MAKDLDLYGGFTMISEVYPNIFKNEIPLPKNPLKAINSYIIVAKNRNLIIDTGFNTTECLTELMKGLDELNIDLNKTDLLITHMHTDHSGLAPALKNVESTSYILVRLMEISLIKLPKGIFFLKYLINS